jgi:short-subunit dehydrogenase
MAAAHTPKGCPLDADQPFRPRPRRLRRSKISKYAQSWALVTGAAREQGLGYAFARQLAVEGLSLLLVDILNEELHARAKELRRQFGVDVRTATCDLGAHAPYKTVDEAVGGLDIDVLVCINTDMTRSLRWP